MDRRVADIEYEQMLLSRYAIAQHRSEGALDRSAYLLLSRIRVQGPMSINELSEAFRLDTSTLQRQTSAALRDNLLERIPDPAGGIARRFIVTEHGAALLEEVRGRSIRSLERILKDWTDEEVAHFAASLRRFNADIESYSHRRSHAETLDDTRERH